MPVYCPYCEAPCHDQKKLNQHLSLWHNTVLEVKPVETLYCQRCDQELPLKEFHDPLDPYCTHCMEKSFASMEHWRTQEYHGFFPNDEMQHEDIRFLLYREQHGKCAICGKPETRSKMALDHNHANGFVRGLLCRRCNFGLGWFLDSPKALHAAAQYLTYKRVEKRKIVYKSAPTAAKKLKRG